MGRPLSWQCWLFFKWFYFSSVRTFVNLSFEREEHSTGTSSFLIAIWMRKWPHQLRKHFIPLVEYLRRVLLQATGRRKTIRLDHLEKDSISESAMFTSLLSQEACRSSSRAYLYCRCQISQWLSSAAESTRLSTCCRFDGFGSRSKFTMETISTTTHAKAGRHRARSRRRHRKQCVYLRWSNVALQTSSSRWFRFYRCCSQSLPSCLVHCRTVLDLGSLHAPFRVWTRESEQILSQKCLRVHTCTYWFRLCHVLCHNFVSHRTDMLCNISTFDH